MSGGVVDRANAGFVTDREGFEDDYDSGDWIDCWNCGGEGYSSHDCGEDTCCCLHPEDNVRCDICDGKGGWKRAPIDTTGPKG